MATMKGLPSWMTQPAWPEPKEPKLPNPAQNAQSIWGNINQGAGNLAAQDQRAQSQLALQQQKIAGQTALQPNDKTNLYNTISAAIASNNPQGNTAGQGYQTNVGNAPTGNAANFNALMGSANTANTGGSTVNDAPPTTKQGWDAWWQAVRDAILVAKQRFPQLTEFLSENLPDLGNAWNPVAGISSYWFHTQELIDAATIGNADQIRDFARRLAQIHQAGQSTAIAPPPTTPVSQFTDINSMRAWWNAVRQVIRDNGGPDIGAAQEGWRYKTDLNKYYFDPAAYASADPATRQSMLEKAANLQQDIERIGQHTGWTPMPSNTYTGGQGGAWADWSAFLGWWNQSLGNNNVDMNLSLDEQQRFISYIKGKYPNATVSSFFRGLYNDYNIQQYKEWRDEMTEYRGGFSGVEPAGPGEAGYPAIAEFMDFMGMAYNYSIGLGDWPYKPQGGGGGSSDAARKLEQQLNALLQKWGNTVVSGAIRSGAHPTSYYY